MILTLASAHAAIQRHAPRMELECEAECWSPDLAHGKAEYLNDAQNWGTETATELMWMLKDDKCPAPGLLVHSRIVSVSASDERDHTQDDTYSGSDSSEASSAADLGVVYGSFGPIAAAEDVSASASAESTRSFSNRSIRVHNHSGSIQMEFDVATPANSCHPSRSNFPVRQIGGHSVGG